MANILITGTDGFIGGVLKDYLSASGMNVAGTVFFKSPRANEVKFDITDRESFSILPQKRFDAVVHTIGIVDQTAPRQKMMQVNSEGTKNLLEWLQHYPCKHFIQISSIAVYGTRTMGEQRTEATTPRYNGRCWIQYGVSKAKAERYIEQSGLPYTILRLPSVLGGNDTFVSQVIIPRLQNGTFYFAGRRNSRFSLLYVKNLGPIVRRLIEIGPQNDGFNCTDHSIMWKEFIAEYARILQIPLLDQKKSILSILWHIQDKKYVYMIVNSYFGAYFPNEKLMQRLQFTPPFPWQAGVSDAIATYMETLQNSSLPHP